MNTPNGPLVTTDLGNWLVQVSKNRGKYKTRYAFSSDQPVRAQFYYNCLNVHSGYNKRLVNPNGIIVQREMTK